MRRHLTITIALSNLTNNGYRNVHPGIEPARRGLVTPAANALLRPIEPHCIFFFFLNVMNILFYYKFEQRTEQE